MKEIWAKNKIKMVAWAALFFLLFVFFIGLLYGDIITTLRHTFMFLDSLKEGNVLEFYEISQLKSGNHFPANYGIATYIIFAVWNFPIWLLGQFGKIDLSSMGISLLWTKGMLLLFTAGTVWFFYLILKKCRYEHLEYAVFTFLSSLLFVVPVLAVAQYDIIHIFFTVCGIYYYIADEKLSWRCVALFSIAISVKFFALFPFLILVLIVEKRFTRIALNMIYGFAFTVVIQLPWYKGYSEIAKPFNKGMIEELFACVFPAGIEDVSVFALGFFAILVVAYVSKRESAGSSLQLTFWLTTAFLLLLFATVECHPQWIVMFLPFLIPVLLVNRDNLKINTALEIAAECAIIIVQGVRFSWVYFTEGAFSHLAFRSTNIKIGSGAENLAEIFDFLGLDVYIPGIYAAFIVCIAALLAVNNPWKPLRMDTTEKELSCVDFLSRFIRIGMVALYLAVSCIIVY